VFVLDSAVETLEGLAVQRLESTLVIAER